MLLTVLSLNVCLNGTAPLHPDKKPGDRWPGLADLIRHSGAHIVLLQETADWGQRTREHALRASAELGLAFPAGGPRPGKSSTLMYDPRALRLRRWETHHATGPAIHGFDGIAVFEVPGSPGPIAAGSAHLSPVSVTQAAEHAAHLAWRARRYGDLAIIGGDINHHPRPHPDQDPIVDPATLPAANVVGRWNGSPEDLRPDFTVAEIFARCRYTDTAAHFATRRADPALLKPTGRGGIRVDQIHVSEPLVPALTDYRAQDTPHTDHQAIQITLETTAIDPSLIQIPDD